MVFCGKKVCSAKSEKYIVYSATCGKKIVCYEMIEKMFVQ